MKVSTLLLFSYLFLCNVGNAQCDSSADMRQIFQKLDIDKDFRFLQKTVMHLRPSLDAESLGITKKAFSTKYFVRQLKISGRYVNDTLTLEPLEIAFLDSLEKHLPGWTKSKAAACKIGRQV